MSHKQIYKFIKREECLEMREECHGADTILTFLVLITLQ
jgi:hypothetical protein